MDALDRPNILFIMTDQQRFDTIGALGNPHIHTPNFDRLVRRGLSFSRAYTTCPVCVAARYTIRTGCEPPTTRVFKNALAKPTAEQPTGMEERCGPYLGRVMSDLGYRTFGIGKFHTSPWNEELGFETFFRSEETYGPVSRLGDSYAAWLAREHPEFDFVEQLMGERTEMYYMPQRSPLPAALGVEAWAADRVVEQITRQDDDRPYFGFVSFVGPHPPLAPPIPFNRMYDPDRLPDPVFGARSSRIILDEEIPYMRYAIWADAVNEPLARIVKARYYGEISYIDSCIGKILDRDRSQSKAENTLICFFSDHGDLLGITTAGKSRISSRVRAAFLFFSAGPPNCRVMNGEMSWSLLPTCLASRRGPPARATCVKASIFLAFYAANLPPVFIWLGWPRYRGRNFSKSWSSPMSGNTFS